MENHVALSAESGRVARSSTSARKNLGDREILAIAQMRQNDRQACDKLLALLIEHHADHESVIKFIPKPVEPVVVKISPPPPAQPVPVVVLPVAIPESAEEVLPSIDLIMRETASFYETTVLNLKSEQRGHSFIKPRFVAMHLARTMTLRSLPTIGKKFGGRDHTTVLHAVRKIAAQVETDERLRDEVEVLKLRIRTAVLNLCDVASRINSGDTPCSSAQTASQ